MAEMIGETDQQRNVSMCRLCSDSGESSEADLYATVPMCGFHPRYPLCLSCYDDIADECEAVVLVEDTPEGATDGR